MIQFLPCLEIRVTEYPDGFDVEYEIKQAKMFPWFGPEQSRRSELKREFGRERGSSFWDKSSVDITDEYLVPRKRS